MAKLVRRSPALLAAVLALAGAGSAQIEHGGRPASELWPLRGRPVTLTLPEVDVAELRAQDARRRPNEPLRFGARLGVEGIGLRSAGEWEALPSGERVWRLRVESRGAYSLSLVFSRFQLPEGAELFVYDDDRRVVRGAYTYRNHKPNGRFAIQPIPGEAVTLEYREPAGTPHPGQLELASVIHDYVDVLGRLEAGACNIDASCGAAIFGDQIDATLHILNGNERCSGVLLNNTAQDGTQLLLTAEHCGELDDAIFTFNFQRPACGGGTAPTNQTVQGSVRLVSDAAVDFQLVRVVPAIPESYGPFLAGWDRSGTTPASTVAISHPAGDEKAIAFDADPPSSSGATQWHVEDWEVGTTEAGSSGCGLFDAATGRVVGELFGGFANCNNPVDDFFVRMDAMWPGLAPFLDPLATGQSTLDGYDPDAQPPVPLAITSTTPGELEVLMPGTGQDVRIHGAGFTGSTTIEVDGVPVSPASYGWINTKELALDFPLVPIGQHTITVRDGPDSEDLVVQVVPPATPKLQVGDGEPGYPVVLSVDFVFAGTPGDLIYMTFSTSNVPSVIPQWMLDYGNQFTELSFLGMYTIPAEGFLVVPTASGTNPMGTRFYGRSTLLPRSLQSFVPPAVNSNLQEWVVFF